MSQRDRPRLLVVDDSPQFVALLGEDLSAEGYVVDTAKSGEECLAKATAAPPDAILLDVSMPGLSGLETCIRLRKLPGLECIPVIFMTGHNPAEGSAFAAVAAGGDDFIEKPYRAPILFARVAAQLQTGERHRRMACVDESGFAGFTFWRTSLERELLRARLGAAAPIAVAGLRPLGGSDHAVLRRALADLGGLVPRLDVLTMADGVLLMLLCGRGPGEARRLLAPLAAVATGVIAGSEGVAAGLSADGLLRKVLAAPVTPGIAVIES